MKLLKYYNLKSIIILITILLSTLSYSQKKTDLSIKHKEQKIIIIDKLSIAKISVKEISNKLKKLKIKSALIIDSNAKKNEKLFKKSILNINNINLMPVVGMNVYDILKFNNLIISKEALVEVEKRLI